MKGRHKHCGGDGGRLGRVFLAAVRRESQLPSWEQFRGAGVGPTYLGRVAVHRACRELKIGSGDEILVPSYNCGSEIDPLLAAGVEATMYRVNRDAQIDVEDIMARATERTRAVYVTHYFGWGQPLVELAAWCRTKGLVLIEDCALALFSHDERGPLGTTGDAAVFSLRKFLPVPDGGVLRLKQGEPSPGVQAPSVAKTLRGMLPLFKSQTIRGLERVGLYSPFRSFMLRRRRGDVENPSSEGLPDMPADYYFDIRMQDWAMSTMTKGISAGINPDAVIRCRRSNYAALQRMIEEMPHVRPLFRVLPEGVCPMAMPMLTPHRDVVVAFLNAHGIAAFPFWKGYHRGLDWSGFAEARHLKDHLLTLPVHQALTTDHMAYIARVLAEVPSRRLGLGL